MWSDKETRIHEDLHELTQRVNEIAREVDGLKGWADRTKSDMLRENDAK